jgi:hypothetical protein
MIAGERAHALSLPVIIDRRMYMVVFGRNICDTTQLVSESLQVAPQSFSDYTVRPSLEIKGKSGADVELALRSYLSTFMIALSDQTGPYHQDAVNLYQLMEGDQTDAEYGWETAFAMAINNTDYRDDNDDIITYIRRFTAGRNLDPGSFYERVAQRWTWLLDEVYDLRFMTLSALAREFNPGPEPLQLTPYIESADKIAELTGEAEFSITHNNTQVMLGTDLPLMRTTVELLHDKSLHIFTITFGGSYQGAPLVDKERLTGASLRNREKEFTFSVDYSDPENPVVIPHVLDDLFLDSSLAGSLVAIAENALSLRIEALERSRTAPRLREAQKPPRRWNRMRGSAEQTVAVSREKRTRPQVELPEDAITNDLLSKNYPVSADWISEKIAMYDSAGGGDWKFLIGRLNINGKDCRIIQIDLGKDYRIMLAVDPDTGKAGYYGTFDVHTAHDISDSLFRK